MNTRTKFDDDFWIRGRAQKWDARSYAIMGLPKKKHTLWLPGNKCLCVTHALDQGMVDKNSRCLFVECDQSYVPGIQRFVDSHDWKYEPEIFPGYLSKVELPWKVDYAFLDFIGSLERKTTLWLAHELATKLRRDADLAITLSYAWRANAFLYRMQVALQDDPLYHDLQNSMGIYDDNITVPVAILMSVFRDWTFHWRWPMKYKDTRSMLVFRMEDFRPANSADKKWPQIEHLFAIADQVTTLGNQYSGDPLNAAKKASATRKDKKVAQKVAEEAKPLSPAQKAWVTRRAKALIVS